MGVSDGILKLENPRRKFWYPKYTRQKATPSTTRRITISAANRGTPCSASVTAVR